MDRYMYSFLTRGEPTLDDAVLYVTSALSDPMQKAGCRTQLRMAVGQIEEAFEQRNEIMVYKIGKTYPELSRAGIRFLTMNRSPAEHAGMVEHLVTRPCNCHFCETAARVGYVPGNGKQIIAQTVLCLANLINGQIEKLHQHKFRTEHANKEAGSQPWPQGPDDLLPFGVKNSVEALIQWVSGDFKCEASIFTLTGKLATFYEPFAKEVLAPPFTLALKQPIRHLDRIMKRQPDPELTLEENATQFVTEARGVVSLFNSLGMVDKGGLDTALFPMGEWAFPIFNRVEKHLLALPLPQHSYRDVLRRVGDYAGLYKMQQAIMNPGEGTSDDFMKWLNPEGVDDVEEAFNSMAIAKKGLCWNAHCPSGGTGVRARFCSQCKFIRYCSEECQREAWKSKTAPHKRLCLMICALKEQIGPRGWDEMWSPGFNYDHFKVLCERRKVDLQLVQNIGHGLAQVWMIRSLDTGKDIIT